LCVDLSFFSLPLLLLLLLLLLLSLRHKGGLGILIWERGNKQQEAQREREVDSEVEKIHP